MSAKLSEIAYKSRVGCINQHVTALLKEINSQTFANRCMDRAKNGYYDHSFNVYVGCDLHQEEGISKVIDLVNEEIEPSQLKIKRSKSYFHSWTVHFQ